MPTTTNSPIKKMTPMVPPMNFSMMISRLSWLGVQIKHVYHKPFRIPRVVLDPTPTLGN